MTGTTIALPMSEVATRVTVRSGRSWSVIEHLLLESICRQSTSIGQLASGFGLPRQVVNASLMRLLRIGWIELHTASGVQFVVTKAGAVALTEPELPNPGQIVTNRRTLLFDRIEGHVFKRSELRLVSNAQLQQLRQEDPIVVLEPRLSASSYRPDELADIVLKDDEQFVAANAESETAVDRFGLVRVTDDSIKGLPSDRSFAELEQVIAEALRRHRPLRPRADRNRSRRDQREPTCHAIDFRPQDLIVGGAEHRACIEWLLETAESRLIIHSTFLDERVVVKLLPLMAKACARGVSIDILFGQDPLSAEQREQRRQQSSRQAAASLQTHPIVRSLPDALRIHTASTHSHAKVLIADVGARGRYVAVVGSCNWLASGYVSVEASVLLRTPGIVSDVLCRVAQLATACNFGKLSDELVRNARILKVRTDGHKPNAKASLVVGTGHNACVLRARDEAHRRIYMTSHRMGRIVTPGILIPFAQACARQAIDVTVLWGQAEKDLRRRGLSEVLQSAAQRRVKLEQVRDPRIHCKILAWDKDLIVVTSQNWLSRDPPERQLATEIGVVIDASGAADRLIRLMEEQRKVRAHSRHRAARL